eukprot:1160788-Pelagomonas_calceolata.AAC.13
MRAHRAKEAGTAGQRVQPLVRQCKLRAEGSKLWGGNRSSMLQAFPKPALRLQQPTSLHTMAEMEDRGMDGVCMAAMTRAS